MDAYKKVIFAFQLVKPHLIQSTVLGIRFYSAKYTAATVRYAKIFEHFHSFSSGLLIKWQAIAMVRPNENKPLQNAFKRI